MSYMKLHLAQHLNIYLPSKTWFYFFLLPLLFPHINHPFLSIFKSYSLALSSQQTCPTLPSLSLVKQHAVLPCFADDTSLSCTQVCLAITQASFIITSKVTCQHSSILNTLLHYQYFSAQPHYISSPPTCQVQCRSPCHVA